MDELIDALVAACEDRDSSGRYMGCRICGTVYQGPREHDADCPVLKVKNARSVVIPEGRE